MSKLLIAVVVLGCCLAACDKSEKKDESGSSASSAKATKKDEKGAASSEAKSADGCGAGAYVDPAGVYCIKLPPGFELDKTRSTKNGDKQTDFFSKHGLPDITVFYWPKNDKDVKMWTELMAADGDTANVIKERADIDGGKGKYNKVDHPAMQGHDEQAFDVGKTMIATCGAAWREDEPGSEAEAGVCKTLTLR